VLEGRGKKHLSESEKAERLAGEVLFLANEAVQPPSWLTNKQKQAFASLEELLRKAKIMSALDADTLGRYVISHDQWLKATGQLKKALSAKEMDMELVDSWSRIQDRFFKQARNCATDLGLTITSRCRLVVPEGIPSPEENPFERMKRDREARRNA
jgi:P27 family predicted phage terminase small subunit